MVRESLRKTGTKIRGEWERDCRRNGRERECVRSREKIAKEIDRGRRRDGKREIVYRD